MAASGTEHADQVASNLLIIVFFIENNYNILELFTYIGSHDDFLIRLTEPEPSHVT